MIGTLAIEFCFTLISRTHDQTKRFAAIFDRCAVVARGVVRVQVFDYQQPVRSFFAVPTFDQLDVVDYRRGWNAGIFVAADGFKLDRFASNLSRADGSEKGILDFGYLVGANSFCGRDGRDLLFRDGFLRV